MDLDSLGLKWYFYLYTSSKGLDLSLHNDLGQKKRLFEDFLNTFLLEHDNGTGLYKACAYSMTSPGKRLRPLITMLSCESAGGQAEDTLYAGLAIEMIHTFSLIHDDLPAIDNDDMRRGMPTCHSKFGEPTAILAGDSLIFLAIETVFASGYATEIKMDLLGAIGDMCGMGGLVLGEYKDIMAEAKDVTLNDVEQIYLNKTSRLFELSAYAGSRIAGAGQREITSLRHYGRELGLAFQAIDDILDITSTEDVMGKTVGGDMLKKKATIVRVLGMDAARKWAEERTGNAVDSISYMTSPAAGTLRKLARDLLGRIC